MPTPEKPPFLDKPEDKVKEKEGKEPSTEKKLYVTGRGEVISEREKRDLQRRTPDEIR